MDYYTTRGLPIVTLCVAGLLKILWFPDFLGLFLHCRAHLSASRIFQVLRDLRTRCCFALLLFDLGFHSLFLPPRRCHTHHALPCCALQVASWTQMISTARPTHCYLVVNLDAQKMKLMDQERSHLDHWKTLLVHWTSPRLPWNLVTSHPLLSIQGTFLAARKSPPMRPLQG